MTGAILGLLAGIAFGFVIQRVGATNPHRMARAHLMIDPDIPRFMLAAVVFSAVGLVGLSAVGSASTNVLPTSIVATGLAGIVFGVGWGLTGYCPGTTWAAAGEGRIDAVFALIGGLCGAAVFAQLHELLIPVLYDPTNVGPITLADWFNSKIVGLVVLVLAFTAGIYAIGKLWHPGRTVEHSA